jgi:hypothetical protein
LLTAARQCPGAPMRTLLDDVWCLTCEHEHIPDIPATTFRCASNCGFGAWEIEVAERHATEHPDHVVYPNHHATIPLQDRERAQALRDKVIALRD